MKGCLRFSGVGRIVELPNLPDDPDNVGRDDLVFPEGIMHPPHHGYGLLPGVRAGHRRLLPTTLGYGHGL